MKRTILTHFLLVILCQAGVSAAMAKEWRGIVPLSSVRADVERKLGQGLEKYPGTTGYSTQSARITITYSLGRCAENAESEWDVKEGTVLHIVVEPKKTYHLSSVEPSQLELFTVLPGDYDLPGTFYYLDEKNGASMFVHTRKESNEKSVATFYFFPRFEQRNIRCTES